jgi:hypothetical protein
VAQEAARGGLVCIRPSPDLLPLLPDDGRKISLVEFAFHRDTLAIERGGVTGLTTRLRRRLPDLKYVALRYQDAYGTLEEKAKQIARETDILVLATRSTHINPVHLEMANRVCAEAKQIIVVCLRNPYDAELFPEAVAIYCTCGDSSPSLQAAVDALMGDFTPAGQLPVPVNSA